MTWAVLTDGVEVHVVPTFGPEHTTTPDCWCRPEVEQGALPLYVHNVVH